MKILRFITMLSLLATTALSQNTIRNGVFMKDGVTTEVGKAVYQFTPTNGPVDLYFSNDLFVRVNNKSDFTVNMFTQEVLNTNTTPEKVIFGSGNLATTMMDGSAIVVFGGTDTNSSCIISTPLADLELNKGAFVFIVSEKNLYVFVLEGALKSYAYKKELNVVTAGYTVVAFPNDKILEDKVFLGSQQTSKVVTDKMTNQLNDAKASKQNIMFISMDNKLVGVVIH